MSLQYFHSKNYFFTIKTFSVKNHLIYFYRYGEPVNINLVRDKDTGKQKGYGFLCYEDQRSTILAVDNLNGAKVKNFSRFTV